MPQHNPLASWTVAELQEQHALAGRYQQLINQELAYRFTGVDRRPPGFGHEAEWAAWELCDSTAQLAGIAFDAEPSLPIVDVRPLADLSLNTHATNGVSHALAR